MPVPQVRVDPVVAVPVTAGVTVFTGGVRIAMKDTQLPAPDWMSTEPVPEVVVRVILSPEDQYK